MTKRRQPSFTERGEIGPGITPVSTEAFSVVSSRDAVTFRPDWRTRKQQEEAMRGEIVIIGFADGINYTPADCKCFSDSEI